MPGLWISPTEYHDFSDSRVTRRLLTREFAGREAALDYTSWLGILPDPDPVLVKHGGGFEILEDLTADAHVCSEIQKRKLGTIRQAWHWKAGSLTGEDPPKEAERLKNDLAADLENVSLDGVISQILDAPLYGYTPIEIMWEPAGDRLCIRDLRPLPCKWFGFTPQGEPRFLSVMNAWTGLELPFGKFVFARHFPSYENPYGLRLLSRCFWPVLIKKNGLRFWATLGEKFGIPFLVGKHQTGASADEIDRILTGLMAMAQDAVAVIPEGTGVEILEHKGSGGEAVNSGLVRQMDQYLSQVITGQHLTSQMGEVGSRAAAEVHESMLENFQDADQALVKTVMEEIAWLYTLVNGSPGMPSPAFYFEEEEDLQKDRADRDEVLSRQITFTKTYFVNHYGLTEDEFEIREPSPGTGGDFSEGSVSPSAAYQKKIDHLASDSTAEAAALFESNEQKILAAVMEADSYEDAFQALLELYPSMDLDGVEDLLGRAFMNAGLFGQWAAADEAGGDE